MAHNKQARDDRTSYWSGAHTLHRLRVHLVWIPKYRLRVLQGPIAVRLDQLLRQAAQVNRWQVHELAIQPDHIHLLLQIPPTESISRVVHRLKGGTSRVLRLEFGELEEFLWGKSFWADGYFVETVGTVEESRVRAYIREQQLVFADTVIDETAVDDAGTYSV